MKKIILIITLVVYVTAINAQTKEALESVLVSKKDSIKKKKNIKSIGGAGGNLKVQALNQVKSSKHISELVEEYISDCVNGAKPFNKQAERKFCMQLGMFVEMIADPVAKDLTIDIL